MFSFDKRISYSETDSRGLLAVWSLLDIFQDCANYHTEAAGLSLEALRERSLAWVLNTWQVDISRLPAAGERVRAATYPYGFHGFVGFRNFTLDTADGERLAIANTQWTMVDPATGYPVHGPEDIPVKYEAGERLDMDYQPRKIKPRGTELEPRESISVRPHMLDFNGHVNNVRYVALASDYLPEGFEYNRLRVEYKRAAHLGDTLRLRLMAEEGYLAVVLDGADGKPYALVEFSRRG